MKLLDSDIKTREILEWKGIHLLNYQFSACSMKTRIYLNLKNIPFKSHQINLSAGENFSQWFQGINPRSLVPDLIHDGDVHIESNDILQYLEGCFENNPLIPADKKMKVSELLSFEDNLHIDIRNITFRFMVPKLLNKGKKAKPKSNDKATLNGEADPLDDANRNFWKEYEEFGIKDEDVTESLSKMNSALKNIDSILNGNEYILGANLSVIDIAWFIYVTRIQHANYPLQERHPNVYEWYKRLYKNKKFKDEVQIPLIMKLVINLYALFLKIKGRGITNFLPQ